MADNTIQMGKSPEEVAHMLLRAVALAEKIAIDTYGAANRKWILDTYAECLTAVLDWRDFPSR